MGAAGADHVFACEWNPAAVEALQRGLALLCKDLSGRCEVLAGDNRRTEVIDVVAGRCHRVVLGMIPTSRDSFPVAVRACGRQAACCTFTGMLRATVRQQLL